MARRAVGAAFGPLFGFCGFFGVAAGQGLAPAAVGVVAPGFAGLLPEGLGGAGCVTAVAAYARAEACAAAHAYGHEAVLLVAALLVAGAVLQALDVEVAASIGADLLALHDGALKGGVGSALDVDAGTADVGVAVGGAF